MRLRDIEQNIIANKTLTSEEEEFLVERVKTYWSEHPDVTYRHPRWKKVLAWVAGYQYLDYHREKKELMPVKVKRTRKLVFNRLKPFVRTVVGKMNSTPIQTGVVPKTSEYEDIQAAEVGDLVVESLSSADKLNMNNVRRMFTLWLVLLNRAGLRVYWNENSHGLAGYGKEYQTDETGNVEKDEQGNSIVADEAAEIPVEGEVVIEVVSPFNFRSDPLHFEPSKWRWFLYADKVDAEDLEDQYGLDEGSLKDDKDDKYDNAYSLNQSGDSDFDVGTPETKEDVIGRTAVLYEFWTPKVWVLVSGNKVLDKGQNPWGAIPYFVYEERLVPIDSYEKGLVFNDSIIKDLIPIQREYNRFCSLISLALERASKVKVMAPFDSLVNKSQLYDDNGLIIVDYNDQRGSPHQLKLDPLPAFAMQFKQELEREMESGGNVHEASFGRLPERASHASGALVNLLVEQDDQVFDPLIRAVDDTFSQAWSLALKIIKDNYTTKRMLRVCGRDAVDSVIMFEGADLRGNTDVLVTSQLGLPKSRALRIEWIMKMRESGLIPDDKLTLEMLETGQAKKVYADQLLHERKARRENMLIEKDPNIDPQTIPTLLYDLDDDAAHMKIHLRDRLSPKFNQYAQNQQQALDTMIGLHQQRIQQAQQAQMQQMMMMEQMKQQQKAATKETAQTGSNPEEATLQTSVSE